MDLPDPAAEIVSVSRVIDGDTLDLRRPDPRGRYERERVRMERITAPEVTGGSRERRRIAYSARRRLRALTVGVEVAILRVGVDKYDRTIARLWVRDAAGAWVDVETILVIEGLASWWRRGPRLEFLLWAM